MTFALVMLPGKFGVGFWRYQRDDVAAVGESAVPFFAVSENSRRRCFRAISACHVVASAWRRPAFRICRTVPSQPT
jgi:hypothetical protein